jgi:hypothetical protein
MFSTEWAGQQTAGTRAPQPSTRYLGVVGFDGTAHALRALDTAVARLHGREGSIELVYVADPSGNTRYISEAVRNHLLNLEPRWHFNGAMATVFPTNSPLQRTNSIKNTTHTSRSTSS